MMSRTRKNPAARRIAAIGVGVVFGIAGLCVAAPQTQPSIDELLGLPHPSSEPTKPSAADETKEKGKGVAIDPEVARRLSGEQTADLFREALVQMGDASDRLGKKLDAGLDTQRVQEEVLAKLDRVLDAVNDQSKNGKQGSPSGGGTAGQPDRGSEANAGQKMGGDHNGKISNGAAPPVTGPEHPDVHKSIEETKNEWGNLPPRVRDELRQGRDEPFSPIYREMTEKYYQGLAEEGK